ncbi:general secretion pathway protein GspB, partial [Vulcaniibacterium tengchongense]
AEPAPGAEPARAAPPTPADPTAAPLRLAELGPGERQQLPPLKMSMHLWAPDPARRFAIVDGVRVGEGDRIGAAVVEAIVQDGVILNWQGRRLRLSMR